MNIRDFTRNKRVESSKMKGQNLIKSVVTIATAFFLIFGAELRTTNAQFMNGRHSVKADGRQDNDEIKLKHDENSNNINHKKTIYVTGKDIVYNPKLDPDQNKSNILELLEPSEEFDNLYSYQTLVLKEDKAIHYFDETEALGLKANPPDNEMQISAETLSEKPYNTNYPIISNPGEEAEREDVVMVFARQNFTGDRLLYSEANVINQSDILHLDSYDANRDENDNYPEIGRDAQSELAQAPANVENPNARANGSDRRSTIKANSNANNNGKNNEDNLAMTWWVQLLWSTVFVLMICTAIGGNCIVMWIVIAHKRMRTVTNYFLVNLSCTDLLLSTLNCFFNFIYMLQGNWQFGGWYCTVNNFIANTTVAASVFTLTAMCCDRYFAIVHPLHPRMSKITAIVVIVLIWCLSMGLATPCLFFSTTVTYRSNEAERTACILIWPDGQPTDSQMDFCYQVLFLIITYVVPMVLMSFFYTSIGKVLWGSQSIGERTQMQLNAIKSKRKVVKMIIFIVLIFAICWLPYHAYFIYTHFDRSILYTKYVQHVYLAFYWFAMANAMVNPLIYYWMNAKFRGYFQRAICCWRPHDLELDANLHGRTFKSTRCEEEATRISLRHLKHSAYVPTTVDGKSKSSR